VLHLFLPASAVFPKLQDALAPRLNRALRASPPAVSPRGITGEPIP